MGPLSAAALRLPVPRRADHPSKAVLVLVPVAFEKREHPLVSGQVFLDRPGDFRRHGGIDSAGLERAAFPE